MKKQILILIFAASGLVTCQSQAEKEQAAAEEKELKEIKSSTEVIKKAENDIKETSMELDSLVGNL